MKRLMIATVAVAGIIVLLLVASVAWEVLRPSRIVVRNIGDQSVQLLLTDADGTTQVWADRLGPGRRATVNVRFKGEGVPELRCHDGTSSNTESLGYVTDNMPMSADIEIAGCADIAATVEY